MASFVVQAQLTALNADAWLDVNSGDLIKPARILIDGSSIRSINAQEIVDAIEIDLPGYTLLPGLIDSHTHLTRDITPGWREQPVRESEADWALRGARNALLTLKAGFTTVRDLGSFRFADISLMNAINKGFVPGPDMITCGHIICRTGGHCDFGGYVREILTPQPEFGMADGREEIIKAVRHQVRRGAKVIKVAVGGGATSEAAFKSPDISDEELEALVTEAHRHNLKVAAHAHAASSVIAAVKAGVDSVEHGFLLTPEAIELMVERNTWLVPTIALLKFLPSAGLSRTGERKAAALAPYARISLTEAINAGVRVAFGTDAAVVPHGHNAVEFDELVELGMSNLDAIRTATVNAAELLGLPDRGQITPGYRADIIAVKGNPLEDISQLHSVEFVMKAGDIYSQP
ncbi:metal-dependent hydrolase family protein [Parendozoicomonas haliclonae]|nr:amidohydrolase family protein [Parendozoicomonas haliclonae]